MKNFFLYSFGLLFIVSLTFVVFEYEIKNSDIFASIFFVDSVTADSLRQTFNQGQFAGKKLKILVIPGHEDRMGGTEFGGVREADLNLIVGENLVEFLKKDSRFDVTLSRTKESYHLDLQNYFTNNRAGIMKFISDHKVSMQSLLSSGAIREVGGIDHNTAPQETAIKLYGTSKWANENNFDILIHIHFNDHGGRKYGKVGKYNGFAVYVPDVQYSNGKASSALAKPILDRLNSFFPISDLPQESAGIIPGLDLIAIGANNTVDGASILIEYAYIYELAIQNASARDLTLKEFAYQTYLGVLDFFGDQNGKFSTTFLPYEWSTDLKKGSSGLPVLALQSALTKEGLYPPFGSNMNDCPMSGTIGACTLRSIRAFQTKYGITGETERVGLETRMKLNESYAK